jgi:hypothetical protein
VAPRSVTSTSCPALCSAREFQRACAILNGLRRVV